MSFYSELVEKIENKIDAALLEQGKFAAILGENPSSGARSPQLWNAVFENIDSPTRMYSFDIREKNLEAVLSTLQQSENFLGGAIAVPYKSAIAEILGQENLSAPAKTIGAINCLYRGEDKNLRGTNTDGEGAIRSLHRSNISLKGKKVLLYGLGGAGKAVASYLNYELKDDGCLYLGNRSSNEKSYTDFLGAKWIGEKIEKSLLNEIDLFVNCTSLGFGSAESESILSADEMDCLPKTSTVFDIVYQPDPSKLLQIASAASLRALSGDAMNLEQAILAFEYAVPELKNNRIVREIMEKARKQ